MKSARTARTILVRGGALIVTAGLVVGLAAAASAAVPTCQTSTATTTAYTVNVCINTPATSTTVSGDITAGATVSVPTGTSPGLTKTQWSINGVDLATDYQTPHQFTLSTKDFADGDYTIGVAGVMRDGYVTPATTVTVTFANGNATTPVNPRQWTVPAIHGRAPSEPFVVAGVGDGAGGETNATNVTNTLAGWNPDLFLYLGDVYENGTLTEFKNWYGGPDSFFGRVRGVTTPVVGNHEYTGSVAAGYFHYWDNIPHYYSYDANGWHFIALDSTSNYNKVAPGTEQYNWLAADLAANRSPCTVVFWHHPLFTIGSEDPAPRMQPMWDLMANNHVTMLLTGHDHQYQRWTPMIAGGVVDPSGIVEIVAGTGGHSSQGITRTDSRAVKTNKSYGAFRMDMFGNRADLKYYAISATANTLVDSSTVTCKGTDGLAPTAPANLTATAGAGSTAMLGWAASTDNYGVTGYRVYRDGTAVADLAGSATSWTDTTSAGATTYTYAVDAVDAAGNRSVRSNSAAVTIGGPDTTAPTVPTGLNATPSASAVSLSWSASTDNVGVTGYRVLRDGVVVDTTSATTYADSTVEANTTHNWAVRAFDAAGNTSAASASVASVRDTVAPSTPGNLRVTGIAPGAVSLAWDASTDNVGVKTYRLYRDGGVLAEVAATTFTDYTAGGAGTTHTYQVRAVDAAGNASAASNSATANAADSSPPTVPTGLQATATGPNRVSLSWTASTDDVGVSSYTVFRNGTAIASTATTTFQDTSPLSETTYSYTILARDAAGNSSAQSTAVAVTTPAATAIAAVADTYVKATTATSNYGRATSLRVDGDPATNAYLKFTVAGVTGPVLRARLRIWVVAGSSTGFVTHPVADSSWSETLTNWNNAPAIGSAVLSSSGATTVGTWVTVDITPLVTGNGTVTVALTSGGLSAASYGSRESSMAPQLLLDATS